MNFIYAFLFGGILCFVGQILIDKCKFLPIHLVVLFVVIGSLLECFNIYDYIVDVFSAGAMIPISSFGHSLTESAVSNALETNYLGLFTGIFNTTSVGISISIISAFIIAIIFKPRG